MPAAAAAVAQRYLEFPPDQVQLLGVPNTPSSVSKCIRALELLADAATPRFVAHLVVWCPDGGHGGTMSQLVDALTSCDRSIDCRICYMKAAPNSPQQWMSIYPLRPSSSPWGHAPPPPQPSTPDTAAG